MDEIFDQDLAGMVSFTDETTPAEMPAMERKQATAEAKEVQHVPQKHEAVDAQFIPFTKTRDTMDKLRSIAAWLGICGGISMLMWWFWMNGLMAMEAAYPCILASAAIGGIGVGRSSK